MLCRTVLFLLFVVFEFTACTTEFCTRHSDCPPTTECGATGICESLAPREIDANWGDGSGPIADAMATLPDAMPNRSDAMAGSDAMASVDAGTGDGGGTSILDSGLRPPDDAATHDAAIAIDASPGFTSPEISGTETSAGATGGSGMTEELDAGLAP